jgi:two-component system response regulator CiaR
MNVINSPSVPVILWLEDDPQLIEIFREDFEQSFQLKILKSFTEFKQISSIDLHQYAAFLIDMELADGCQGINSIEHIKQFGISSPILVLSNDESIQTRLMALKLGIEDYMWKAMTPEEISLRITNSIKRGHSRKIDHELALEGLSVQPLKLIARLNDQDIDLTKIEFQFLNLLMRNHPQSVDLNYLRDEVWRIPHVEIGTINTFIWKLNKKLSSWQMRVSKEQEKVSLISKDEI